MPDQEQKATVLIVDDAPENLQTLTSILSPHYRILAAMCGEKALSLSVTRLPDLVLLDIVMPGLDGFDVIRQLKSDSVTSGIPVIFISASASRDLIIKGFQAGAQDYITKPFEPEELKARVTTQVQIKKQKDTLNYLNEYLESEIDIRTAALESANRELKDANERLNAFSMMKSRFLNIISHELRTPLAIMQQFLELYDSVPCSVPREDISEGFHQSYARLHKVSEKALLITHLDDDTYPVRLESLDMNKVIEKCIDELSNQWKEKSLHISMDPAGGFMIKADPQLSFSLFYGLLENAIRYSPDQGNILIVSERRRDFDCVRISDEGTGFPHEILHHAFELFNLGEEPVRVNLGLSLAISHLIMKAHEGSIKIKNTSDEGGALIEICFRHQ